MRPEVTKMVGAILAWLFVFYLLPPTPAQATVSIKEARIFSNGSYAFKMEIHLNGNGHFKKPPVAMTSVKIKIKNDRASSEVLKVRAVRAYIAPNVFQDIETGGYSIKPGQWVTKFYRFPKGKRPLLTERSHLEISFEGFSIRFYPRDRKFRTPEKTPPPEKAIFFGSDSTGEGPLAVVSPSLGSPKRMTGLAGPGIENGEDLGGFFPQALNQMGTAGIVVYGVAGMKDLHLLSHLGFDLSLQDKNEFLPVMGR